MMMTDSRFQIRARPVGTFQGKELISNLQTGHHRRGHVLPLGKAWEHCESLL